MEGLMQESRVHDWTRAQWAVAALFFADAYGWLPFPTIEGANKIMSGWWNRQLQPPSCKALLLDERGRPGQLLGNHRWAQVMFRHAALEARVIPFREGFIGGEAKGWCRPS